MLYANDIFVQHFRSPVVLVDLSLNLRYIRFHIVFDILYARYAFTDLGRPSFSEGELRKLH